MWIIIMIMMLMMIIMTIYDDNSNSTGRGGAHEESRAGCREHDGERPSAERRVSAPAQAKNSRRRTLGRPHAGQHSTEQDSKEQEGTAQRNTAHNRILTFRLHSTFV